MAGIYRSNSSGAASPYGAPTARLDMPNGQPEVNKPAAPQGPAYSGGRLPGMPQGPSYGGMPQPGKPQLPSYGGMQSPGRPQGPAYGQNPKALAAALSTMAPQMGSHVMPNGSMMANSAMPAPMGAPMMPPIPAQMPIPGMPPQGGNNPQQPQLPQGGFDPNVWQGGLFGQAKGPDGGPNGPYTGHGSQDGFGQPNGPYPQPFPGMPPQGGGGGVFGQSEGPDPGWHEMFPQMPMGGKPDPMAEQRKRDKEMAGVWQ